MLGVIGGGCVFVKDAVLVQAFECAESPLSSSAQRGLNLRLQCSATRALMHETAICRDLATGRHANDT
jgi:hypothetical protein